MNGATADSSFSQQSCPITTSPLSLYLLWISFRCGMLCRQGPHHVAQNSTRYALSFSKSLTGSPCIHLDTCNGGALSPTLSVAARDPIARPSTLAKTNVKRESLIL